MGLTISYKEKMKSKKLISYINNLIDLKSVANSDSLKSDLELIKERVSDDTFRIAVVGEFSSGKSTFINALIGTDLLTHAVNETTATITRIINVKHGDPKIGKCRIIYRNGKSIMLDDMKRLRDYTTAQSSNNVAETILSASVFVDFIDANFPIEIIDTPGLNGIADKHREITIGEVKQAHVCIYLLPLKGPTATDADFMQVLFNYQNRFIFIQNFIDQLIVGEGETVESKLDKDKELINETIAKKSDGIVYDICGISALKKLCSKDKNIKKLYANDLNELTDEERADLEIKSHFGDFENILRKLTENENYKKIMICSGIQAVNSLIDKLLPTVESARELNAELRQQDDKSKRVEKVRCLIQKLNNEKESSRKMISNFIQSRDKDNRKGLKELVDHELCGLYSEIETDIDKKIATYEQLESFERTYKKTAPQYYCDMAMQRINSEIIPDIDSRIIENLSHLYDEAAQRATDYAGNFSTEKENINLSIQSTSENLEIDKGKLDEISKDKATERRLIEQNKILNKNNDEKKRKLMQVEEELRGEESAKNQEKAKYDKQMADFGARPDAKEVVTRQVRSVKHRFLFFKYYTDEEYDEISYDYSEQEEWERVRQNCTARFIDQTERRDRKIREYKDKINRLKNELRSGSTALDKNRREIEDLNFRITKETEIFETTLKNSKMEYCNVQKNKLKKALNDKLFNKSKNECTIERLERHIDKMSEINLKSVSDKIDLYFVDSLNRKIASLEKLVDENIQKLDEQYNSDTNDIETLRRVRNALGKSLMEDQ